MKQCCFLNDFSGLCLRIDFQRRAVFWTAAHFPNVVFSWVECLLTSAPEFPAQVALRSIFPNTRFSQARDSRIARLNVLNIQLIAPRPE